ADQPRERAVAPSSSRLAARSCQIDPASFDTLRQFRAGVYDCFCARRDALFELLDAATVAGLVPSLAYLSLPPVHRRRWGSLYDALTAGTPGGTGAARADRPLSVG